MRYDTTVASVIFAAMWMTGVAAASRADTAAATYAETTTLKVDGPVNTGIAVPELDKLDEQFATGDMRAARATAIRIIDKAKVRRTIQGPYDYNRNYLAVVWVGTDIAGKLIVRRLVVPQPVPRPYAVDLPGIGADRQLYELFLAVDPRATLVSVYRSTPEENPILQEIPGVVSQIVGPLFGVLAGVAGEHRSAQRIKQLEQQTGAPLTVYVTASRVMLPYRRAVIQTKSLAVVPKTPERLKADVDLLAATLRLKDAAGSPCAQDYADQLAKLVITVAAGQACQADTPPAVDCMREFDSAFVKAFTTAQSACRNPSSDDTRTMKAVDKEFREFVLTGADQVTADVTFRNKPLAHLSFAAVSAFAFAGEVKKPRVKLNDNGDIVADPLGRLLTMIALNWSPRGYDADLLEPSNHERYRFFGGAIITPDFGVGGGGSLLLVRGLAINAGIGVVFSRAVQNADDIGKPPAPEKAADPFVLGTTRVLFVGASFNLK